MSSSCDPSMIGREAAGPGEDEDSFPAKRARLDGCVGKRRLEKDGVNAVIVKGTDAVAARARVA